MRFIKIIKREKEIFEKLNKAKIIYKCKTYPSIIEHLLDLAIEGNNFNKKD